VAVPERICAGILSIVYYKTGQTQGHVSRITSGVIADVSNLLFLIRRRLDSPPKDSALTNEIPPKQSLDGAPQVY